MRFRRVALKDGDRRDRSLLRSSWEGLTRGWRVVSSQIVRVDIVQLRQVRVSSRVVALERIKQEI